MKFTKIIKFTQIIKYELWNLYIIQNKKMSCLKMFDFYTEKSGFLQNNKIATKKNESILAFVVLL